MNRRNDPSEPSDPRPRAAVITPFFVDRDAVCNDVFHSVEALRKRGWNARIFALDSRSERATVSPLGDAGSFLRSPQDLAYFHYSTGEHSVTQALAVLQCRKVVKFHNITPSDFFSMWSDELAEASRAGRAQIPHVAGLGWERAWANSTYSLAELAAFLPPSTPRAVIPPFHETDALLALRPGGDRPREVPRLLTVGRLVQNKGHAFLLRLMRYLVHELGTNAILDIVGKPDPRMLAYMRMLELMVREFRLEPHVSFHGEISSHALAERYGEASVFLCASEHEGFCVPIVEAMAFGVPVVALATTAVPETVGDAGIVWAERDPRRFAVTVQRLLAQPGERSWLAQEGRRRFEAEFSNAVIERKLAAAFGPVGAASGIAAE